MYHIKLKEGGCCYNNVTCVNEMLQRWSWSITFGILKVIAQVLLYIENDELERNQNTANQGSLFELILFVSIYIFLLGRKKLAHKITIIFISKSDEWLTTTFTLRDNFPFLTYSGTWHWETKSTKTTKDILSAVLISFHGTLLQIFA